MPTPDRTSLAEIVEAGRALIEDGGASRLTMQAVAERVGVRPPSLYKRVRDRDALLVLVAEATVDDLTQRLDGIRWHSRGSRARVPRLRARRIRRASVCMFTVDGAAGSLDRVSAPILRVARDLVGEDAALDAARLITAWATGFIDMELAGAFRLGGDVDRAFEFGLERLERRPPRRRDRSAGRRDTPRAFARETSARAGRRVEVALRGDRSILVVSKGPLAVKLVKRIIIGLVIAFAVFYLVTRPQDAATAVQNAIGAVWGAGVAVVDFFVALASG